MRDYLIWQSAALLTGFLIDCLLGDPYCLPHPVRAIGKLIDVLDKKLRHGEKDPRDLSRGILTVVIVCLVSAAVPAAVLYLARRLSIWLWFAVNSLMCWQLLAARQLAKEGLKVMKHLEAGDVEGARTAVSYIVGRDTNVLDDKGICRAAVETVAENSSDGVIAPLFWILLFGVPGGFFYKAVNTMDSMLGYKNDAYLYFGRAAAKTDDFVNLLPSRLSAWLMILGCPFCGLDQKNAVRIFKRDRFRHDSPNSAQTESVCAGALRVRLAGDAVYGGIVKKKEFIGDPLCEIEYNDIAKTVRLMYAATVLMLILILVIRLGVFLCFFNR